MDMMYQQNNNNNNNKKKKKKVVPSYLTWENGELGFSINKRSIVLLSHNNYFISLHLGGSEPFEEYILWWLQLRFSIDPA